MKRRNRKEKGKRKEEKAFGRGRSKKGSLTVECAFLLPLFFLAVVVLVSMVDLYRISGKIQSALYEGARELALYSYLNGTDSKQAVETGICMAYGAKKVREELEGETLLGVQGGKNGIQFIGTEKKDQIIKLKAVFLYRSPVAVFQGFPRKIEVCASSRAWVGYQGEDYGSGSREEEELVYLSDWESVYHTTMTCTHLNLKIQKVSVQEAEERRNQYGGKYTPCEKCGEGITSGKQAYITEAGDRIHLEPNCSGLKRYVKTVKKSETGGLRACSRCGGG